MNPEAEFDVTEPKRTLREWEQLWRGEQATQPASPTALAPFLCPECASTTASTYRVNRSSWSALKELGIRVDPTPGAEGYFFVSVALKCDRCGHLIPDDVGIVKAKEDFSSARMRWQTSYKRFEQRDLDGFAEPLPVPQAPEMSLLADADQLIAARWQEVLHKANEYRNCLGLEPITGTYENWISGKYDDDLFGLG